jgi:hypothetical protein
MIVLDKEKLKQLGIRLRGRFDTFEGERRQLELQWLTNLRQYKAVYDSEILKHLEGRSKVYPKDTHTKIVGWVAKMMEMMFPAQEKNWSLEPTPFPNIAIDDLKNILITLEQQQVALAEQQEQPTDPAPVTSEMIEEAVKAFAVQRAERMALECEDQLADSMLDYPELCKKVVRRGGIYGFGVAEGPLVYSVSSREWVPDATGQFAAVAKAIPRPYYESLQAWDVYPDLSAKRWEDQTGLFTRKVMPKHNLLKLAEREDFIGDVITEYLRDSQGGNYKARSYEGELNTIKHLSNNQPAMSRQYEIIRYYGFISAQELKDIGADVPDAALGKEILADVWLLDSIPIKADTAPFGEKVSDMFHVFIPEEDEDGPLTGTAKVEVLRDSQMKLCAIDRCTMDNMAATCRSIVEVNEDLLEPESQGVAITGGMTIRRHGEGAEANYPAIRTYDIPSHIPELLELRKSVLEVFDVESNLPSWRMGNAQPLGEAFRTTNNMSMMASGGDMVTKDDVRSFDRFVKSMIGSLVRWNMEFNTKKDIKGDFIVQPKGNLSLVAKEVRGAALSQLKTTLTPRQMVLINEDQFLIEEFLSRDLPRRLVKTGKEAQAALDTYDQQQAQAAQTQAGMDQGKTAKLMADAEKATASAQETAALVEIKVQEKLSVIAANLAKAKGAKDGAALHAIKLLLDASKPEGTGAGAGKAAAGAAAK